ncbi:nitroreductase [Chloroflexota bacterium]
MELSQAIKSRKSIRGFKADPVPKKVLTQLLELAQRAPSGQNTQSWEFYVLGGKVLDEIKQAAMEQVSSGAQQRPDLPAQAPTGVYRQRQIALAVGLFHLMDITREDKEKRNEWGKKGYRFYDAPVGIVIAVDESAPSPFFMFDVGIVTHTIALVALEFGLGTCILGQAIGYPDMVRKIAGIPESKKLVIGIAIGYPDWDFPANKVVSEREPLENVVTWCGLD